MVRRWSSLSSRARGTEGFQWMAYCTGMGIRTFRHHVPTMRSSAFSQKRALQCPSLPMVMPSSGLPVAWAG